MTASKLDLVNGKESISAEAKRMFSELDFSHLKKNDFVRLMLDEVVAPANDVHAMVKHLEAVWRGKAAPTMAELNKARTISNLEPTSQIPISRAAKSLERMGIVAAYQPKYPATKQLKEKFSQSKKNA